VLHIGTRDTNILIFGTILNDEDLMADLLKGKIPGVRSIRKASIDDQKVTTGASGKLNTTIYKMMTG
jgi:hypothetical protein